MAQPNEKLTITLTDRTPVKITKEEWPIIASAKWHDGREVESQSNRRNTLIVRQHNDGRTIVYGIYDSNWQGEKSRRGGELITVGGASEETVGDTTTIIAAIRRVAEGLGFSGELAQECIADLPAEEI